MVMSTWNYEYALQWQSTKIICIHYARHPMHLLVLVAIPKSIFICQDRLNRLNNLEIFKCFVRFVFSMESLSKGGHKKGTA